MAMSSKPARALTTPRAAAVAGVIFALLFGAVLILIGTKMPERAGAGSSEWLNSQGSGIATARTLMPFAGISFCGSSGWSATG